MSGIGSVNNANSANNNSQLYTGGNDLESELHNQIGKKPTSGNGNENEGANNEDLIMMNIPREGNADQLNKSTKLTMSSKKTYENHLQNKSINNGTSAANNQYVLQMANNQSQSA